MRILAKLLAVFLLLSLHSVGSARAAVRLCLKAQSDQADQEGFAKLVVDELARHDSHQLQEEDCQAELLVQLFTVKQATFLTARINQQVPVRYRIEDPADLSPRLAEALSLVLAHDPVYLTQDITRMSAIQRAAHSVLKRGHNRYRLELFQGLANAENNLALSPGLAFGVTRGAEQWQVYVRAYFAGWPQEPRGDERQLQIVTGADLGIAWESNARHNTAFFAGAGLGLQYLRFAGLVDPAQPNSLDERNDFGPTFHVRAGLRLLRIYDFDCDFFVAGYLPMFGADENSRIGDFYPPSLQLGMGVGF